MCNDAAVSKTIIHQQLRYRHESIHKHQTLLTENKNDHLGRYLTHHKQ